MFPELKYEEDLRGTVINENDWVKLISDNEVLLSNAQDRESVLKYCEILGLSHRTLNQLDQAEAYLQKALSHSCEGAGSNKICQNLIRLAHVYQWKKEFAKSKALFDQVRSLLNEVEISDLIRAAYHQHLGKYYFDQKLFGLANTEFSLALKIRNVISAPVDQIESSKYALSVSLKKWHLKISPAVVIRRARVTDSAGIHTAHMKSINEICSKDHTAEEIRVWGGRSFEQINRAPAIRNEFYLVVEVENSIEGFCQLRLNLTESGQEAHLFGLYLTPEVIGKGIGHMLMSLVIEFCESEKVNRITLKSSITAFEFYKKYGFIQRGELSGEPRNGVIIRGYPMEKRLLPAK